MRKDWGEFNSSVWSGNKNTSIYRGESIRKFITLSPAITKWWKENLILTGHTKCILESLILWTKISNFLRTTTIYDKNNDSDNVQKEKIKQYEIDMKLYSKWVARFYELGLVTFMTKSNKGDEETFYLHTLRYYMPDIIEDTWKKYKLGVGIFTMQGFERRNKESKHSLSNHNNYKGNYIIQNLNRLYTKFDLND